MGVRNVAGGGAGHRSRAQTIEPVLYLIKQHGEVEGETLCPEPFTRAKFRVMPYLQAIE